IFKLFVNITGIYYSPYQIALLINHPNDLITLFEILKKYEVIPYSLLTWKEEMAFPVEDDQKDLKPEHKRMVFLRVEELPKEKMEEVINELKKIFKVLFAFREDISKLPRKEIPDKENTFFV
ncbi:MAG: hypothetical protein ACK4GE_00435, partial [Caldimicrobium sp.]